MLVTKTSCKSVGACSTRIKSLARFRWWRACYEGQFASGRRRVRTVCYVSRATPVFATAVCYILVKVQCPNVPSSTVAYSAVSRTICAPFNVTIRDVYSDSDRTVKPWSCTSRFPVLMTRSAYRYVRFDSNIRVFYREERELLMSDFLPVNPVDNADEIPWYFSRVYRQRDIIVRDFNRNSITMTRIFSHYASIFTSRDENYCSVIALWSFELRT